MRRTTMRQLMTATLVVALAAVAAGARAEDKNADPAGTWKWEVEAQGQKREQTLKLTREGDKVSGVLVAPNGNETAIEDASFRDGELSFKVTRDRNGQKVTAKYTARVSGDTLKGNVEIDRDGQSRSHDWEARRARD
jgi:hypothetical protein